MGLFSKIGVALGRGDAKPRDAEAAPLAPANPDHRVHARYQLVSDPYTQVTLTSGAHAGLTGIVKDLSYGGLAAQFKVPGKDTTFPSVLEATFRALDRTINVKLGTVRTVNQGTTGIAFAGFTFFHESPEGLIFLRECLEPLRFGQTMVLLADDMRHERYRGAAWSCWRGDGPTDLLLKSRAAGGMDEALLTFRDQNVYREVSFLNGSLKTGRSLAKTTDSSAQSASVAQMASTADLDLPSLRQAAFILIGMPQAQRAVTAPLLAAVIAAIPNAAGTHQAA